MKIPKKKKVKNKRDSLSGSYYLMCILIIRAKQVCIYIQNHHAPNALYNHYSSTLLLKVPPEIRFACNFLILEVKDALE
jgi:hypothetical protein